jgi:hypothetical protein
MKRILKIAGLGFAILLVVAASGVWNLAFRTPPLNPLPLPDGLISIESPTGRELLAESRYMADYERLAENFVSQGRRAFCGVATSVIVLNALRRPEPPFTQATFFSEPAQEIRSALKVTFAGMNLAQLRDLLRAHRLEATMSYASDVDADVFRSIAKENLRTSDDLLLVNYQRDELGQGEIGHISPIAAYHTETDRLLILDVAAYKYPPVWVSTEMLWNAMKTVDDSENRSRGFIVVREGGAKQAAAAERRNRSTAVGER